MFNSEMGMWICGDRVRNCGEDWKPSTYHEEDDIEEDDEVVDDDAEGLDSLRCVFCELCLLVDSYLTTDPRTPLWTISWTALVI